MIEIARHFSPEAPVSVIGCSMGTGALLHAVTTAPERFDRLIITAPPTAWEARAAQSGVYLKLADYARQNGVEALAKALANAPVPAVFAEMEGFPPTRTSRPSCFRLSCSERASATCRRSTPSRASPSRR
jgi:pimeloyl-ACP methyl ester carboxylesterase